MSRSPSGTSAPESSPTRACRRRQMHGAARVDADQRQPIRVLILLDDLVGDTDQRPPQIVVIEHDLLVAHCCAPSWPRGTGLKGLARASVAARPDRDGRRSRKRDDPFVRPRSRRRSSAHRGGRPGVRGRRASRSFVREQGDGDPVVLMHGVPVSSFLYRKVLPLLAERGLRGVAFDLPGLGLAEKPEELRLHLVGPRPLDGRGDRRARDRALPPRPARHRRADRARVGARATPTGCDADGARHADRRRRTSTASGRWASPRRR